MPTISHLHEHPIPTPAGNVAPVSAIMPPAQPLFVGSWVPLQVNLAETGRTADEVTYVVPDGPDAGIVSYARFADSPGSDPVPLLIAGGRPGSYLVEMVDLASGVSIAQARFEVTSLWTDVDTGPSRCVTGVVSEAPSGADWGGGPNAPQNLPAIPKVGTWRVAVLMVNTSDGSYPTGQALTNAQTELLNHVEDGDSVNGTLQSLRQYYEENSGYDPGPPVRGLTVRARNHRIYGPVTLPQGWSSYFAQRKDDHGNVVDDRWLSIGGTAQGIVSEAVNAGILTSADFSEIDSLIIVPFSPDATGGPPARFVWPHASLGPNTYLAGTNILTDWRTFSYIFVPPDFDVHDGRAVRATLSHETGHNLRLPDLYSFPEYSADVNQRLVGGWDMMAGSRNEMPHYSLSNKMRMGWVDPANLRLYNFKGSGGVNDPITLQAAEINGLPAGQVRGIEVRIADGWNYYVEYRAQQPSQFSDIPPIDKRVVITEVTSDSFVQATARPPILLVHDDADGDGPILSTTQDFEETDPGTQMDLVITVNATTPTSANVQLTYGSNGKPDPGIRPWNGAPNWQSPDIEIRNDRSLADPSRWGNTPWIGHSNTVVAKVRNNGDILASNVQCDFFVTEFSAGDGPWIPLGSDHHNIAPGATVDFTTDWAPPSGGHYCIIARLPLYQDPVVPAIVETNIFNNEARSNFTRFVSASSSPSTRVGANVALANPYDESTLIRAVVRQRSPMHRVFIDHQWLRVPGKSSRNVTVFDEALAGTPEFETLFGERALGELWEVPNLVSVEGWADKPFPADCLTPSLTGGAAIEVAAGRATNIDIEEVGRTFVTGFVRFVDDGSPVTNGMVLVDIWLAADPGQRMTTTCDVQLNGRYGTEWRSPFPDGEELLLTASYLGSFGAAPSDTDPQSIP